MIYFIASLYTRFHNLIVNYLQKDMDSEDTAFLLGYTPVDEATTIFAPILDDSSIMRQEISCIPEDLEDTAEITPLRAYQTLDDACRLYWMLLGRLEAQHVSYGRSISNDDLDLGLFLYGMFSSKRPRFAAVLEPYLFPRGQWHYCNRKWD